MKFIWLLYLALVMMPVAAVAQQATMPWRAIAERVESCRFVGPSSGRDEDGGAGAEATDGVFAFTPPAGHIVQIDCGSLLVATHELDQDRILVQGLVSSEARASSTRAQDLELVQILIEQSGSLDADTFQEMLFDRLWLPGTLTLDRLHPKAEIRFRNVVLGTSRSQPVIGPGRERLMIEAAGEQAGDREFYEEHLALIIDGSQFRAPLIFENVNILGATLIQDTTFHGQLRFDRMTFHGPVVIANAFFAHDLLFQSKRGLNSEILFQAEPYHRNVFLDQLLITNVDVKGDIDLTGSAFSARNYDRQQALPPFTVYASEPPIIELHEVMAEDSIKFANVLVDPLCAPAPTACFAPSVTISDSRLLNKFEITDSDIPYLQIRKSELGTAHIANNRLLTALLGANRMNSLAIEENFIARTLSVQSNNSRGGLQVFENSHGTAADLDRPPFAGSGIDLARETAHANVIVNGNVVGSDFSFSPLAFGDGFANVDLRKNAIDGDAQIMLPVQFHENASAGQRGVDALDMVPQWRQWLPIDLSANRVGGTLFLQLSRPDPYSPSIRLIPLQPPPNDALLTSEQAPALDRIKQRGCSPIEEGQARSVATLSSVRATTLSWELPFADCLYRWDGSGFAFQQWGDNSARFYKNGEPQPVEKVVPEKLELLLVWRGMANQPSPEVDRYLGDHLIGRGEFSDGRELHLLARKGNYIPPQHRQFEDLAFVEAQAIFRPATELWGNVLDLFCRGEKGDATDACEDMYYPWIRLLTSPSGYGAKPEWSAMWILMLWVTGVAVYWSYVRYNRPGWRPTAPEPAMPRPGFPGLAEAAPTFAQEPPPASPGLLECFQDFMRREWHDVRASPWYRPDRYLIFGLRLPFWPLLYVARDPERMPGDQRILTEQPGFLSYDTGLSARSFSVLTFSLDAVLPVIDLHCYSRYYPRHWLIRFFSHFQHIMGWWLATNLLAAAAIGFG